MSLNKTINIILLDSCTKTAFSYGNTIYQQCDGVSMGSSLAPILANIILTEFEKVVVAPLMKSGILKGTVLEFQFWSVKCMVVTRLRKKFEQLFFPIQAIQSDHSVLM